MSKKKESKGNLFNLINDAATDPKLQKQMVDVINTRGKGLTPEKLLKKVLDLGYDGASLRDCTKILVILKTGIRDVSAWDWSY